MLKKIIFKGALAPLHMFLRTMIIMYVPVRHTYLCITDLNSKLIVRVNDSAI
jgi:hypothetical protein